MEIYNLNKKQYLPIPLDRAWAFFSTPENLSLLTPQEMNFNIDYNSGNEGIYQGQLIKYNIKLMPGVKFNWLTEITSVEKNNYFIDEQRYGPYRFWHHQHWFQEHENGVLVTDIVNYALPWWSLGQLSHPLFVKKRLESIFEYRSNVLAKLF